MLLTLTFFYFKEYPKTTCLYVMTVMLIKLYGIYGLDRYVFYFVFDNHVIILVRLVIIQCKHTVQIIAAEQNINTCDIIVMCRLIEGVM